MARARASSDETDFITPAYPRDTRIATPDRLEQMAHVAANRCFAAPIPIACRAGWAFAPHKHYDRCPNALFPISARLAVVIFNR